MNTLKLGGIDRLVCDGCGQAVKDVCCLPTDKEIELCEDCFYVVTLWGRIAYQIGWKNKKIDVRAFSKKCKNANDYVKGIRHLFDSPAPCPDPTVQPPEGIQLPDP